MSRGATAAIRSLLVALGILSAHLASSDDTDGFLYQPDRVPVGRVFHYVRTSFDGKDPVRVALFIATRDRIEKFSYRRGGTRAGRNITWMDWTGCSVRRIEGWEIPSKGEPVLHGIATAGSEGRSVDITTPPFELPPDRIVVRWRPWHTYQYDLVSLNVAMAHLTNPRDTVTMGLVDPSFADIGDTFRYRGEARLAYVRDETRGGEKCRLYTIDGSGLDGKVGLIWSRERDGYFQDVEIGLGDKPDYTSYKLTLERVGRMSEKQWEKFVRQAQR